MKSRGVDRPAYLRARRKRSWSKVKIAELRCRARRLGVPFDLREEDIVLPPVCPVLGTPLTVGEGKQGSNSPSVDRIIPAAGYVRGNIVVVSQRVNSMKQDATIAELEQIAAFYKRLL